MTRQPDGAANPLLELLRSCVVRVDVDGEFKGTGFFVAPGEVLTCAHVVRGAQEVTLAWDGGASPASVMVTLPVRPDSDPSPDFYPFPDAALLALTNPPADHPCVRLTSDEPALGAQPDVLQLSACTKGAYEPDQVSHAGARLTCEDWLEQPGLRVVKLRGGQVVGGYSGGPALNLRTAAVCALIDSSRDVNSDLGGFGVPIGAILDGLPGLAQRNADHHAGDNRWQRTLDEERVAAADRTGARRRLNLIPPRAELDWTPEDAHSELLRPRYRVVDYIGRRVLLAGLAGWREEPKLLQVAVLAGDGGAGKTRAAIEVCAEAERAGWLAGMLPVDGIDAGALEQIAEWPGRLLVAVDYAETRPDDVTALLQALLRRPGPDARVLLVVRQRATREELLGLFATGDRSEELRALIKGAEVDNLGVHEHEMDRVALFQSARGAFRAHLATDDAATKLPDLRAGHFELPLMVLVGALIAAQDPKVDIGAMSPDELLLCVIDEHESRYWQQWDIRAQGNQGLGLDPAARRKAVAMATLLGAQNHAEAMTVLALAGLRSQDQERADAIGRWLSKLYSAEYPRIAPLEPDRLGEVLVVIELLRDPHLLGRALDAASDRQLTRMLTVMARASGSDQRAEFAATSRAALDDRLTAIVSRLADMATPDLDLIAALRLAVRAIRPTAASRRAMGALPANSMALGFVSAEITALAVDGLRELAVTNPDRYLPDLANALNSLSNRLAEQGQPTAALTSIQEAVTTRRTLATTNPARHLPDLTMSLNNMSLRLAEIGQPADALNAIQEAITNYRTLANSNPDHYLPNLTGSLNNLSVRLAEHGQPTDALHAIQEAITNYRTLANTNPDHYLPGLASSLNNLSNLLAELGQPTAALHAVQEAVTTYRTLTATNPDRHLPDLAGSLNNLSVRLIELGQIVDALSAIREAVTTLRTLANTNPDHYLPDLATSLNNLSNLLAKIGRPADALHAIQEAITIYRTLTATNPDRHLPDLAGSLSNLSLRHAEIGQPADALHAIQEAITTLRTLATTNPDRHLPDLARSLSNLSLRLAEKGRPADALYAIQESITTLRALATTNPGRHRSDLARSLNNLSNFLAEVGQPTDALSAIQEAITIRRTLATNSPDSHLPDLARSLSNLSIRLAKLGQPIDALSAIQEAITIRRTLAINSPDSNVSDLAVSLNNLSNLLAELGQPTDALNAIQESITIRRTLAANNPDRHMPGLARSLYNLSNRFTELGQPANAEQAFTAAIAEHQANPWATGVLTVALAQHHRDRGDLPAAIGAFWRAVALLDVDRDPLRRGQARTRLSALRAADPNAFDAAWATRIPDEQPVWLRHPESDQEAPEQLIEWVNTPDWDTSFDVLAATDQTLLTDQVEAALEHLIDAIPGQRELLVHLAILQAARRDGVDATRLDFAQQRRRTRTLELLNGWLATPSTEESKEFLAAQQPILLTEDCLATLATVTAAQPNVGTFLLHLGLLELAIGDGIDAAYQSLAAADPAPNLAPDEDHNPHHALAIPRLNAGVAWQSADAQIAHAVAAQLVGNLDEAAQAILRCGGLTASWERTSFARRLRELADQRPAISAGLLRVADGLGSWQPTTD